MVKPKLLEIVKNIILLRLKVRRLCAAGLKQITGRGHYNNFSKYRNENPFPGDNSGNIDFTEENIGLLNGKSFDVSPYIKF